MIKLARVDARLIHGQTAAIWLRNLGADMICVVSDSVAADPFMCELYTSAVPDPNVTVKIFKTSEAADFYKNGGMDSGKVMLIFHNVATAEKAYQLGLHFDALDLGQAPSGAGKKKIYLTFYVTEDEEKKLQTLKNEGVTVYCQGVPDDKKVMI